MPQKLGESWTLEECMFFLSSGKRKGQKEALQKLNEMAWEDEVIVVKALEHFMLSASKDDLKDCLKMVFEKSFEVVDIELLQRIIKNENSAQINYYANLLLDRCGEEKIFKKKFKAKAKKKGAPKTILERGITNEIVLSQQQGEALERLKLFFEQDREKVFVLSGYAGTGKSTLCSQVLKKFKNLNFVLTASTNKAVSVLRKMSQDVGISCECFTIHKFLNLVPDAKQYGSFLVQTKKTDLSTIDVVIIDECSMINKELMYFAEQMLINSAVKIIFIGDPMQLPPVNETISLAFGYKEGYCLSEILRQARDNPIINFTLKIREQLNKNIFDIEDLLSDNDFSGKMRFLNDEKSWLREIQEEYSKDQGGAEVDRVILTWTNRRVAELNNFVRKAIGADNSYPFTKNETVLVKKPIFKRFGGSRLKIALHTDEKTRVVECKKLKFNDLDIFFVKCRTMSKGVVEVFHADFKTIKTFEQNIEKYGECTIKIAQKSYNGYRILETFNSIQCLHAITVHRSQGSTFSKVFVDFPTILLNENMSEAYQMLYVALTRSNDTVVLWQK